VESEGVDHRLAAILSADVVGYSRLMAEDEAATVRTLSDYREEIGVLVRQHRGRVVDTAGDSLLAEFPTATDAVQCAVEIQGVLKARNVRLPAERWMKFRIGVHLGEVRAEGDRIYGDGVNIAARLEGLAKPGGICISGTVQEQVRRKLDVGYEDLGKQELKNIPDPVQAYRVRVEPQEASAPEQPPGMGALTVPGFGGRPAIAVLPFDNLSGDPQQEYFADGIAEDVITRLSSRRWFPVIARNSSFVYRGKAVDVKQVSRELGVRYVVEGSVRKAGNRVRISAQVIDATTGHHVWAKRYDRELQDIFAVQDEITESILSSMAPELVRTEIARAARRDPQDLGAYDLEMRGYWHVSKFSKEDNAAAQAFFEQAIELDPSSARAWYGLAETHYLDILSQWTASPAKSLGELERAARACMSLESECWECNLALSHLYHLRGQPKEQVAALERAVSLNPNGALTHGSLGWAFALGGRPDEAIAHLEKALRLDPRSPFKWAWLDCMSWAHFHAGRYQAAIDWAERSIQIKLENEQPYRTLAASYAQLGRLDEARAALEEELRLEPDLTLEKVRSQNRTTDPDFLERWLDGLRKAGLKD
jgi:adenylate cyclase